MISPPIAINNYGGNVLVKHSRTWEGRHHRNRERFCVPFDRVTELKMKLSLKIPNGPELPDKPIG